MACWSFLGGDTTVDAPGRYSGGAIWPGGRAGHSDWSDGVGVQWVFGGRGVGAELGAVGLLNDLWSLTVGGAGGGGGGLVPVWTFHGGSGSIDSAGSFGAASVTLPSNAPPGMEGAAGWIDRNGAAFIVGGRGAAGLFNALWMWSPPSARSAAAWTWVGGAEAPNSTSDYRSNRHAGRTAWLGAREGHQVWMGHDGARLFGGHGYASAGHVSTGETGDRSHCRYCQINLRREIAFRLNAPRGPVLRCVLVCKLTNGRSIFGRSTENRPAFPQSSRVQPRSQEKIVPALLHTDKSRRSGVHDDDDDHG